MEKGLIVPADPDGARCPGKTRNEHEGSDLLGSGGVVVLRIQERGAVLQRGLARLGHLGLQGVEGGRAVGVVQRLAPLHLLHQKLGWHGGVVFGTDGRTVQLAQVGGAALRVFQALVGLVDAHRPLHGHALGSGALGGKAVGVGLAL